YFPLGTGVCGTKAIEIRGYSTGQISAPNKSPYLNTLDQRFSKDRYWHKQSTILILFNILLHSH
ncbi:MAG: hypothetical protein ACW7DU_19020, partial [Paraglaciecola chathamensis]